MNNNFKKTSEESKDYVVPEECAENEKALQELADVTREEHYNNINLLVMSVLLIFTAVTFIAVNGGDSVDDNSMTLNLKVFMSGAYTQSIEDKYNGQLPVPETLKAVEERISLLYGIGNKVSDPIKEIDSMTDSDRNSFDEIPDDNKTDPKENVLTVTSVVTDEKGETVSGSKKDKDNGKGTTALARPDATTSTTTTTTENTTTNNDAPYVTTTTTEPVPETTTTTTTTTTTETEPTDTSTETTTSENTSSGESTDTTAAEENG